MSVANHTLYIKGEQNVEVNRRDVTLGDLLSMECGQQNVVSRLKTIKVIKIPDAGKHRYVISVLNLLEIIHKEYPNLEVQNLGVSDLIVTYEEQKSHNKILQGIKIIFITLLSFIGAAFAIMTFNNDAETPKLFDQIYELFMGYPKNGFSILELSYSIGLAIGILVFFNHFGKRRFTVDPTPIEVEMRLYENDIQTTIIADYSRKGQEIDVDKTDTPASHRT